VAAGQQQINDRQRIMPAGRGVFPGSIPARVWEQIQGEIVTSLKLRRKTDSTVGL